MLCRDCLHALTQTPKPLILNSSSGSTFHLFGSAGLAGSRLLSRQMLRRSLLSVAVYAISPRMHRPRLRLLRMPSSTSSTPLRPKSPGGSIITSPRFSPPAITRTSSTASAIPSAAAASSSTPTTPPAPASWRTLPQRNSASTPRPLPSSFIGPTLWTARSTKAPKRR